MSVFARAAAFGAACALACGPAACGLFYNLDALGPGAADGAAGDALADSPVGSDAPTADGGADADGATTGDAADAGGDGNPPPACASTRGRQMVSAGGVCIDATETTVDDYAIFLAAMADAGPPPPPCDFTTTYEPDAWSSQKFDHEKPVSVDNFCLALSYCQWAGKHLCGKLGGGTVPVGDAGIDKTNNEWFHACSHDGDFVFPYGNTYAGDNACPFPPADDVGTHPLCVGGYPGLFDMTGNIPEWVDACEENGQTRDQDECTVMGIFEGGQGTTCSDHALANRVTGLAVGIRCCAE